MLLSLKVAMLQRGIKQYRIAVDLGWDPAKLSRIINQIAVPTAEDRKAIAYYLATEEADLFTENHQSHGCARHDMPTKQRIA